MTTPVVALDARVSSEQQAQAQAQTIDSQWVALRERIARDGGLLSPEQEFVDAGYSGSTLIRPALERRRDAVAAGEVARGSGYRPDRLARKYAYPVMLVDEFQRAGVELVVFNRPLGPSPEEELLLPRQGTIAAYERAQRLERSRRGNRHQARQGSVNGLGGAPSVWVPLCHPARRRWCGALRDRRGAGPRGATALRLDRTRALAPR
jgi:site-specific DNA recombinase